MQSCKRLCLAVLIALLSLSAAASAASGPSGRFKVGAYRLYLTCAGSGKLTVVLDGGLSEDHSVAWSFVSYYTRVLRTRVCAYDRYGLGSSDGASVGLKTRTIDTSASDLHALLKKAGLKPPYLFSAQSMGGLIDRAYARRYPKDVAGMVLFDTAPDDWDTYTGTETFTWGHESLNVAAASAALRARDSLGAKPLIVVEAGNDEEVQRTWANGKTDFQAYWNSAQLALARISSNSIYIFATNIGHDVVHGAGTLAITAMQLAVKAARTHTRLPACTATALPSTLSPAAVCDAPPAPADTTTTTS